MMIGLSRMKIQKIKNKNSNIFQTNTDERLRRIGELLVGIKIIKLHAWEKVFTEKIQKSRDNELKCLDMDSIYWTLMSKYAFILYLKFTNVK